MHNISLFVTIAWILVFLWMFFVLCAISIFIMNAIVMYAVFWFPLILLIQRFTPYVFGCMWQIFSLFHFFFYITKNKIKWTPYAIKLSEAGGFHTVSHIQTIFTLTDSLCRSVHTKWIRRIILEVRLFVIQFHCMGFISTCIIYCIFTENKTILNINIIFFLKTLFFL